MCFLLLHFHAGCRCFFILSHFFQRSFYIRAHILDIVQIVLILIITAIFSFLFVSSNSLQDINISEKK